MAARRFRRSSRHFDFRARVRPPPAVRISSASSAASSPGFLGRARGVVGMLQAPSFMFSRSCQKNAKAPGDRAVYLGESKRATWSKSRYC